MRQSRWNIPWDEIGKAASGRGERGPAQSGPEMKMPQFKKPSKKGLIIFLVVLLIIILVAYWWFHPSLNIHSEDVWSFCSIFILLPLFVIFFVLSKTTGGKTDSTKISNSSKAKMWKRISYIPLAVIAIGILGALFSATFFPGNAGKYAKVLETTPMDFASDIQQVDYDEIPVIDKASAALLGNRAMGSIPDYVSQFEISDLYSQINYHGTPTRVSPLGYADFFKWITNRENGIPAYALVDMTTQNTEIVRLDSDSTIHYSQSEPFFRNINRHVQLSYPFYMFDEFSFEIDEDGHPWWICPVQSRTIGLFGGTDISRVVLCDANTGECQDLAIDEVPEWVDRAYPSELLVTQYNWSGRYSNGWWNSWIGQDGVVQTTPGTDGNLGYNYIAKDDDVWLYSGVTSATADNSIVGFVLINQRTAESHFYSVAGATEDSAMRSAEGQVQNLGYLSTFPLLINIDGQPTYFMALKDNAGLVKKYAMIDIQRYQNVAVGDTVEQCQASYELLLASNGVEIGTDQDLSAQKTVDGTVESVAQAVIDGNSHFYFTLEGDDMVYDCALPDIMDAVRVSAGDAVTITYMPGDNGISTVSKLEKTASAAVTGTTPATPAAAGTVSQTAPVSS